MSELREEINAQIRDLLKNIQYALKDQNMEKAQTLTKILALFSQTDVDRAVNPVDPDVRNAILTRVKNIVNKHNFVQRYHASSHSERETFVQEINLLAKIGRIEPEALKPLLKPVILVMIANGDNCLKDLQDYI